MGQLVSIAKRPVKKFNIENRAHKIISSDKPVRAPLHKSTEKILEIAKKTSPNFMEEHYKKDPGLDDRLKNIYIESHDAGHVAEMEKNPEKPLPLLTRSAEPFEYGVWEPSENAKGRCSLKKAMEFMTEHAEDPKKNTVESIALKHDLEKSDVANILEYFRVLKIVVPKKGDGVVDDLFVPSSEKQKQLYD